MLDEFFTYLKYISEELRRYGRLKRDDKFPFPATESKQSGQFGLHFAQGNSDVKEADI